MSELDELAKRISKLLPSERPRSWWEKPAVVAGLAALATTLVGGTASAFAELHLLRTQLQAEAEARDVQFEREMSAARMGQENEASRLAAEWEQRRQIKYLELLVDAKDPEGRRAVLEAVAESPYASEAERVWASRHRLVAEMEILRARRERLDAEWEELSSAPFGEMLPAEVRYFVQKRLALLMTEHKMRSPRQPLSVVETEVHDEVRALMERRAPWPKHIEEMFDDTDRELLEVAGFVLLGHVLAAPAEEGDAVDAQVSEEK